MSEAKRKERSEGRRSDGLGRKGIGNVLSGSQSSTVIVSYYALSHTDHTGPVSTEQVIGLDLVS